MHRSIGAGIHGLIDYLMVIVLFIGPKVSGFRGRQEWFCYVFGAVLLALTLLTKYPLAPLKVVRFPLHGSVDLLLGLLLLTMPWIANFSRGVLSRNFYLCAGMLLLVIWALTDYRGMRDKVISSSKTAS